MSSGCVNLSSYYCNQCATPESGRVSAVAYVKQGAPLVDPTDPQDWFDLLCNGLAIIIPNVRGTYDGGAVVEGPGYGRTPVRRQSANHQVVYNHLMDCNNIDFYNALVQTYDYDFWFATDTKIWRAGSTSMQHAQMPITEDVASDIEFSVTVKWTNKNLPTCYDTNYLFESCDGITRAFLCLTCNPVSLLPC